MFLDFIKAGLAYRKESWVNWDPVENTVLANEQVVDGKGWRSGVAVERRKLNQWFLKITHYAEDLLAAIETLERWPDQGLPHAAQLDRPVGRGTAGVANPWARRGGTAGAPGRSSPPGPTLCSGRLSCAPVAQSSPDHPIGGTERETWPLFIGECNRLGTSEEAIEKAEKKGFDTGLTAQHPFDPGLGSAALCGQLRTYGLRHRRHFRLSGARPARHGFRTQVWPAGALRHRAQARRPKNICR